MAPSQATDERSSTAEASFPSNARADNLGLQYSRAADDGQLSEKRREAALLLAVAEGHLDDDAPEEVLSTISDAIKLFRDIGDNVGLADSLRLKMHGYSDKAALEFKQGHGEKEEATLIEAEEAMRAELSKFRAVGDKRGEAAMLLAVAEALAQLGSSSRLQESLDYVMDAQDISRGLGDMKLEADCVLRKCEILGKRHRSKLAIQAAKDAQKLFSAVGDSKNEGFAWKAMGAAQINNGRVEDGFISLRRAMSIHRRLGNTKQEAIMLLLLAEWYLEERDDFSLSVKAAREAQAIFKDLGDQQRAAQARLRVIKTFIRGKDFAEAEQVAKEGIEQAAGVDAKEHFDLVKALSEIYSEMGSAELALSTAEQLPELALSIADRRYEAYALQQIAQVFSDDEDYHSAESMVKQAIKIFEDCSRRYHRELFEAYQFLGRTYVRMSDYDRAMNAMHAARRLAQNVDNVWLEGHAMLGTSGAYYGVQNFDEANKAAFLAQELFQEEGCHRSEAKVFLLALSNYALEVKDHEKARKHAEEGVRITEEMKDHKMCCQMKMRLAQTLMDTDLPEEAAKVSMGALKLARSEEDKRQTASALFLVLASNYQIVVDNPDTESKVYRQQVEKMARYAKESLGLSVKCRDVVLEGHANLWVARMHLMMGNFRSAIGAAESSLDLFRRSKDVGAEAEALLVRGNALDADGETEEAVRCITQAMRLAFEAGNESTEAAAADLLKQIQGSSFRGAMERGATTLIEPASTASTARRHAPDVNRVRMLIAEKLRELSGSTDIIDTDAPIMDSGIDSLTSVELRTQLQQEFRVSLPSTVIHNYPTVGAMAALVVSEFKSKGTEWRS